ncbi:hypothetical protein S83_037724 [Arachis hypogaea]
MTIYNHVIWLSWTAVLWLFYGYFGLLSLLVSNRFLDSFIEFLSLKIDISYICVYRINLMISKKLEKLLLMHFKKFLVKRIQEEFDVMEELLQKLLLRKIKK